MATEQTKAPYNFEDHGLVAPVGMPTWGPSTIATVDGDGRRIVFVKLWTGKTASYLFIDAETGETEQVYPEGDGWGAYQVLMTPDNVIYDTMDNHLVAIDVVTRRVRKLGEIPSGMAMTYALSEEGTIYAGIYPTATLVSYNPATDTFTDHGPLNDEVWPQYPRPLSVDASGWVYCGISIQEMQVVGYNLATGEKRLFIPSEQRQRGNTEGYVGTNGAVYVQAEGWGWHEISNGLATAIDQPPVEAFSNRTDTFPDGSRYTRVDVADRTLSILDVGADEPREVHFNYESSGVNIYTIIAGPDNKVHGATGIPLRIWKFDPETGEIENRGLAGNRGHINQFVRQGDRFFGAIYSSGDLVEYDPLQPYDGVRMTDSMNPRLAHSADEARDLYGRPHAVLAHPNGRHILVGGNAARVVLGSGLLIYDSASQSGTILDRDELIPNQGINALVALPDGDVLVGTSTKAPTGGVGNVPETAVVYRLDFETRTLTTQWPMQPNTPAVRDMVVMADGLVYGLAEPNRLFVLDPKQGVFTHDEALTDYGDVSGWQAPRCMIMGPDGNIYALFSEAVVCIDPKTLAHHDIARPDVPVTSGIAIVEGRLYFGSGPRLFSCDLNLDR
ncbi:MAG: outer membrane protein assembly factor BamB [Candidatus Latescibacterota bacterium]|jgi:outer membrane protein assembly factor BamB